MPDVTKSGQRRETEAMPWRAQELFLAEVHNREHKDEAEEGGTGGAGSTKPSDSSAARAATGTEEGMRKAYDS